MGITGALLPPTLLCLAAVYALRQRIDVFETMRQGASDGLKLMGNLTPSLIVLLSAVAMLRESGALDALARVMSPALDVLGLPSQTLPLMLLRPFSGSGALSAGADLIARFGPDSYVGRVAAVMLGSTETTFYVLTVYFGAAKTDSGKALHALPAALCADLAGFVMAALSVRLFF